MKLTPEMPSPGLLGKLLCQQPEGNFGGLALDLLTIAIGAIAMGRNLLADGKGDLNCPNRFLGRTPTWPGNTADCNRRLCARKPLHAARHFDNSLITHRPKPIECLLGNLKQRALCLLGGRD